jgi:hypothetical protein
MWDEGRRRFATRWRCQQELSSGWVQAKSGEMQSWLTYLFSQPSVPLIVYLDPRSIVYST